MSFGHALIFLCLLLPAFAAPDLPHTLARISEARARAIANRARLRANSARVINQVRNNRSKRQEVPPALDQQFEYEEPTFVHICPMDDESQARSAEDLSETLLERRSNEDNHLDPSFSLNQALDELMEARRLLDRFEGQRDAEAHRHFHVHQHSTIHGHGQVPLPTTQVLHPGLPQTHGLNLNFHQTQGLNPGLPIVNHGVVPSQIAPIHLGMGVFQTRLRENDQDDDFPGPMIDFDEEPGDMDEQLDNELSPFDQFSGEREANPTLHHKKMKLKQKLNQKFNNYGPPPQYYGHYREAEEREASPTLHKKRKLKQKLNQKFGQGYPQYYVPYREVEEEGEEEEEEREASPTLHKKRKLKQKLNQKFGQGQAYPQVQYYREAEPQQPGDLFQDTITSPYLFDVPNRRFKDYRRSADQDLDALLGVQRQIIDTMKEKAQNDQDLDFLTDISNRTLSSIEDRRKKISKRSIPLTRLISDPNVRLDVPKTFENFGTATKHAFEDERAPMYHLKHLVGSSKNALLSAMRIPPQNMIIPSDYEVVRASTRGGSTREDDSFGNTFKRVGEMVRESIRSGQETVAHISDAAHEARNMLNTARHGAPRLIIPYSQIPALHKGPRKAVLITPRILDLAEDHTARKSSDLRPNFLRLGHLMDAVGFSKPHAKNLDLEKIVFEPKRVHKYNDEIVEALNTLEDAKVSVGAKNLRDLLLKMRDELTNVVAEEPKKKHKSKRKKQQETKEMGKFIETLFDGTQEERVGDMMLAPELLRPFMGRASDSDLHNYLRENGDETTPKKHFEELKNSTNPDLGYVLGAINPLMLERMFNQTVEVNSGRNETVGTAMGLNGAMLKPFMGQAQNQAVEDFLDTYNHDPNDDYVEEIDE